MCKLNLHPIPPLISNCSLLTSSSSSTSTAEANLRANSQRIAIDTGRRVGKWYTVREEGGDRPASLSLVRSVPARGEGKTPFLEY